VRLRAFGVTCWRSAAWLLVLLLAGPAAAWGPDGHRLVAELAEARLAPAARVQLRRLLALEPGATLVSVSTWADEVRDPATASWHYLNFKRAAGCAYDADQQCVAGNCVVAALARQTSLLASAAAAVDRLQALKFVVHLAADVHQPLHAGFADDRGGNLWQLQAFGRGSNLHGLWDSGLIGNLSGGLPALRLAALQAAPAADDRGRLDDVAAAAAHWAEESCRVVATDGFYPAGHELPEAYAARWQPVLTQRLAQAGRRLAQLLNSALAPH